VWSCYKIMITRVYKMELIPKSEYATEEDIKKGIPLEDTFNGEPSPKECKFFCGRMKLNLNEVLTIMSNRYIVIEKIR